MRIAFIISLLFVWGPFVVEQRFEWNTFDPYPLLGRGFLGYLFMISSGLGFLLALGQINSESKARTESFLLHRPVTRRTIFFAKWLSGISMQLLTLPLVYLTRVLWTSTSRGHFGPFRWEMAYPGMTCVFSGLIVYTATLWAATSRGRDRIPSISAIFLSLAAAIWYLNAGRPFISEFAAIGVIFLFFCGGLRAYEDREI